MTENKENRTRWEIRCQLVGWMLFIMCAIFFIASSVRNHDILTFIGSVIFLIACIVFLIPIFRPNEKVEPGTKNT